MRATLAALATQQGIFMVRQFVVSSNAIRAALADSGITQFFAVLASPPCGRLSPDLRPLDGPSRVFRLGRATAFPPLDLTSSVARWL